MQCDFCSREASIEILVNVNGQSESIHLCPSCYRQKMQEMASSLPDQWGGKELQQQIQAMMENGEMTDRIPRTVELHFTNADFSPEESRAFQNFVSQKLLEDHGPDKESLDLNDLTGRGSAFKKQRKSLLRQREIAVDRMETALLNEDYEHCAEYRDRIAEIGDALVRLNEERKDLHGV